MQRRLPLRAAHVAEMILHGNDRRNKATCSKSAGCGNSTMSRAMRSWMAPSCARSRSSIAKAARKKTYRASVFIDATYEGDLAAAAGAPYMLGREGKDEYGEPCAGKFYQRWDAPVDEYHSTGQADNAVQSYNYRLPLTTVESNIARIGKPATYNRDEYVSLIDDVRLNRFAGPPKSRGNSTASAQSPIWRACPMAKSTATISMQPSSQPICRKRTGPTPPPAGTGAIASLSGCAITYSVFSISRRTIRELPADFRERCQRWGLASDEFQENGNFPRQIYVREGTADLRRIPVHRP